MVQRLIDEVAAFEKWQREFMTDAEIAAIRERNKARYIAMPNVWSQSDEEVRALLDRIDALAAELADEKKCGFAIRKCAKHEVPKETSGD